MSIKNIGYILSSTAIVVVISLGVARSIQAQTGAVVRTRPATINTTVGQSTNVSIEVNNVQNFGGYEFKLTFDPQVLQVKTTNGVTQAVGNSFLASTGRTVVALTPIIDNINGSVTMGVYSYGGTSGGPSVGSTFQELVSAVAFDVVGSGTANIQFATTLLAQADLDATSISSTQQGTTVSVAGPSPSASPAANPATMKIRFEGVNEGRGNQTVSVIFKQGTTTTYNQNLVFEPDAANDGVYNYEFSAGTIAAGSYDIFIKGPIHLTTKIGYNFASGTSLIDFSGNPLLAGDVLTNDEVDIFDYGQLVTDFGSRYPGSSPGDLDLDDDIDIFDYSYLVANFGKTGDQ